MNCSALMERLGYNCHESDGTLVVDTPFCFFDGETIGFYISENPGGFTIHDNAGTLAHLMGTGLDLSDRRSWKQIRNLLSRGDFRLQDNGVIAATYRKGEESQFIADYVAGILAVADYEREQLGITEEQSDFIAEVEMNLRAWKPFAPIEANPSVVGHSGKIHNFHFLWDGKLVEATQPHGGRTGGILRKAFDVKNVEEHPEMLVVMDDREDADRARAETDILANVVQVMQFSDLRKHAEAQARLQ